MNAQSHSRQDFSRSVAEKEERRSEGSSPLELERFMPEEVRSLKRALEIHELELKVRTAELQDARRAAEESRRCFRRLYDSAPIGFLTLDAADTILDANRRLCTLLNTPRERLIGKKLSRFVAAYCQERWSLTRRALLANRSRVDLALEFAVAGRGYVDARIVGMQISKPTAEATQIHLAILDLTDLRKTERALQSALAAATLAEERERHRLAADLHDDAGQLVSLASMKLHALGQRLGADHEREMQELDGILTAIRSRITSLSFQLSPPLLHDVGLTASVRWLAEDLEKSHGLVTRISEEDLLDLDESTRVAFYRAVRELLINVVKHAGVNEARIRISRIGQMGKVVVEDAGVGMPPRLERGGFGLLALRERVELMGGSLETRGTPGQGTTVEVCLPCSNITEAPDEDPNPTCG